jgi:hypothetical protein
MVAVVVEGHKAIEPIGGSPPGKTSRVWLTISDTHRSTLSPLSSGKVHQHLVGFEGLEGLPHLRGSPHQTIVDLPSRVPVAAPVVWPEVVLV